MDPQLETGQLLTAEFSTRSSFLPAQTLILFPFSVSFWTHFGNLLIPSHEYQTVTLHIHNNHVYLDFFLFWS